MVLQGFYCNCFTLTAQKFTQTDFALSNHCLRLAKKKNQSRCLGTTAQSWTWTEPSTREFSPPNAEDDWKSWKATESSRSKMHWYNHALWSFLLSVLEIPILFFLSVHGSVYILHCKQLWTDSDVNASFGGLDIHQPIDAPPGRE